MRLLIVLIFLGLATFNVQASETDNLVDISQYKGKIVYLDFWASWCVPCRKSFPWLNKIRQQYTDEQLTIIGVNLDKEHHLATEFLKQYPALFTIVFDPEGLLAKQYKIKGMPSSILFDQNGKIISNHVGFFKNKIINYEQSIAQAISKR